MCIHRRCVVSAAICRMSTSILGLSKHEGTRSHMWHVHGVSGHSMPHSMPVISTLHACHIDAPCLAYRHSMPVISTLHAWHIDILCLHQHSMPGTSKLHAWHIDAPCLSCRHSMPGIHALLIWCAIPHDVCNSSVGSIWLMLTMVHVGNGAY